MKFGKKIKPLKPTGSLLQVHPLLQRIKMIR
jgi:hypothetical protein